MVSDFDQSKSISKSSMFSKQRPTGQKYQPIKWFNCLVVRPSFIYLHLPFVVVFFYWKKIFNFDPLDFLIVKPIMVKIMKSQKVVIVLAGRYAGRKAVIIKVNISFYQCSWVKNDILFSHMMKVVMNVVMVMHLLLEFLVIHVK